MIHPDTKLAPISDAVGLGVLATAHIPRGTLLWALDPLDQVLPPDSVARLPREMARVLETYSYIDARGHSVLCWDFGRFMNHSCEPTSRGLGEFEVAVRDIAPGDEITCEYGTLNITQGFDCACGSPHCRHRVEPDDISRYADAWDMDIRRGLERVTRVPQPLMHLALMDLEAANILAEVEAGHWDRVPSVRGLVYGGRAARSSGGAGPWG